MAELPIVIPYVPKDITVHLGAADEDAPNVTLPFGDYVKNVVSSEVYPTWGDSALQANILAVMSYALNRIYTEYYRSRGYDFDITNSTAADQAFTEGRGWFDNVSRLTDELIGSYIRRRGFVEPLAAKFCNGTTVTCDGLSQWGSEELSRQGYSAEEILRYYYGDDIDFVTDAPIEGIRESYPGTPLRLGSAGPFVTVIQAALNEVGQNYPAIPRLQVDSIFGPSTQDAVIRFQQIFGLNPDGIVGRATWYQLNRAYVAVQRLAELRSEGQPNAVLRQFPQVLSLGDSGQYVEELQYMLSVVSEFIPNIPPAASTGVYDLATRDAVAAFQRYAGLSPTGAVGETTWNALYDQYLGAEETVFGRT